jgi:hypothetical protein
MQHFYDGQIRRYITQMIRLVSNFSYADGSGTLRQVPVMYGDLTKQVANLIRDNSENKIPSAPRMTVYVTGLEPDRSRTSDSTYVSKMHIRERAYDESGNEYLNEQGKNYTVERLMPTPYKMTFSVDIWSTNTDQKLQILEQMLVLFNPSLEIQTTDNYIDWTSLTVVDLIRHDWSNRSIPVGTETEIDIATLILETPIYISAPVKVKKLGVIHKIITSIFNEDTGDIDLGNSMPDLLRNSEHMPPMEQRTVTTTNSDGTVDVSTTTDIDAYTNNQNTQTTTYQDYGLYVLGNTAQLVDNGSVGSVNWRTLLEIYTGDYIAGLSQIRMRQLNTNNYVVGTITINSLDETKLNVSWDNDTLPSNTIIDGVARSSSSLTSIDAIIDPENYNPTTKTAGVRYLLLGSIGSNDNTDGPDAWKNNDGTDFIANENDIIEWDGVSWHVVWDASDSSDVIYTTNLNTGIQYKWDGTEWIQSWEGYYSHDNWMLYLDT